MSEKKIISLYKAMLGLTDITYSKDGELMIGDTYLTSPTGKEKLVLPYDKYYRLDAEETLIFTPGHEEVTRLPSFTVMLYRNALLAKLSARAQEVLVNVTKLLSEGSEISVEAKLLFSGIPTVTTHDAAGVAKYLLQDEVVFDPLADESTDAPTKGKMTKIWTAKIATNRTIEIDGDDIEFLRVLFVKSELLEAMRADMKIGQLVPDDLKVSRKSLLTLMSLLEWLDEGLETVYPVDGNAACIRSLIAFGNAYHKRLNDICEAIGLPVVELVDEKKFFSTEKSISVMLKSINTAPYNAGSIIKREAKAITKETLMQGLTRDPDARAAPTTQAIAPVSAPVTPEPPKPVSQEAVPQSQPQQQPQHELPPEEKFETNDGDLEAFRKLYGTSPSPMEQQPQQPMVNGWGQPVIQQQPQPMPVQQQFPNGMQNQPQQMPYPQQQRPVSNGWGNPAVPYQQPVPQMQYPQQMPPQQQGPSFQGIPYNQLPPFNPTGGPLAGQQMPAPPAYPQQQQIAQGQYVPGMTTYPQDPRFRR